MGCICSTPRADSPRPSSPQVVDPIISTTIVDLKSGTLFFKDQDFDRAILPKMDEDKRNTLLQPNGALTVEVSLHVPPKGGRTIDIDWKYVVTKDGSSYKFELLGTDDRRQVARAMDLLEGDEVTLELNILALQGDDSTLCFSMSHKEIQPKPLLKIGGVPKYGIFLFTKEEFERHILPVMTDADQNALSPDDGTLNVTIYYWNRDLPFVLSKFDDGQYYKFKYVGSDGYARRLDDLHEGDQVRLQYQDQASFALYKSQVP